MILGLCSIINISNEHNEKSTAIGCKHCNVLGAVGDSLAASCKLDELLQITGCCFPARQHDHHVDGYHHQCDTVNRRI
jgi:hypothetical protein